MNETWYDTEKVAYKGSSILTKWKADREAERNEINALGENGTQIGLSPEQLYETLMGTGGGSYTGQAVNEETAMRVSAVYGCVSLISGVISSLPMTVYERTSSGRLAVPNHDYWWLLNEQANKDITASVMMTWLVSSMDFQGDAFVEILRPSRYSNKVSGLEPHHPLRVTPFREQKSKRLFYRVTPADGSEQYILDSSDMIHVPTLGFNGIRSVSPISWAARQNIGIALAAEEYSAKFFKNGATNQIALKTDKKLDKEQTELLRSSYLAKYAGNSNYHMPIILSGGLQLETISINPEDAALITTRQFTVEEICRVFRVPPHMVGHTSNTTSWGTGIEQLSLGFVKYTLRPVLTAIQQELNRKLWPYDPKYFVKFDTSEAERGDLKSQFEAFRIALGRAGERPFMDQNDVRNFINLPEWSDGNDHSALVKSNNSTGKDTEPNE
ncbi:MAG: phage portal protein [Methylophilaceae bacterium]